MAAVSDPDPGPEQAPVAFGAATSGGAHAIGRDGEIGAIAPGYLADLVLIDLDDPSYVPLNSALRQLVYTEGGRGVRTVIVGGRVVIRDGKLATMDEAALLAQIRDVIPAFQQDYAEIANRVDGWRPYLAEAHRRIWGEDVGDDRLFRDSLLQR
jgi:guanine deaminase